MPASFALSFLNNVPSLSFFSIVSTDIDRRPDRVCGTVIR